MARRVRIVDDEGWEQEYTTDSEPDFVEMHLDGSAGWEQEREATLRPNPYGSSPYASADPYGYPHQGAAARTASPSQRAGSGAAAASGPVLRRRYGGRNPDVLYGRNYDLSNRYYSHDSRPLGRFSSRELKDLAIATAAMTVAFSFAFANGIFGLSQGGWGVLLLLLPMSFVAAGTGFFLHELGHKYSAQYFGLWSEFVLSMNGIAWMLAGSILIGWIIPSGCGAVVSAGNATRKQNGIIAAAGPIVNLVIVLLVMPLTWAVDQAGFLGTTLQITLQLNLLLAMFNLIPLAIFGNALDGRQVADWNWGVWGALMGSAILLLLLLPSVTPYSQICGLDIPKVF